MTPDAGKVSVAGLTVSRPDGWVFVAPDKSLAPGTLVVLQGPHGEAAPAPAVEISRRPLSAMDQRKRPAVILTGLVAELAQVFEGLEGNAAPQDTQIASKPAARLDLTFSEGMPDGTSVARAGRFYGIVAEGNLWLVRCLGPADGSAGPVFDQIVSSIGID